MQGQKTSEKPFQTLVQGDQSMDQSFVNDLRTEIKNLKSEVQQKENIIQNYK